MIDPAALIARAKEATNTLRDAARDGRIIDFRTRDPLVLAIHAALDAFEQLLFAQRPQEPLIASLQQHLSVLLLDYQERLGISAREAHALVAIVRRVVDKELSLPPPPREIPE